MAKIPEDYLEKVYVGWLGKVIGVRHGSNIEGWTYQRIKEKYGEITGYLFDFKNFAADDDTNGPMFFLRALNDFTYTEDVSSEQIGLTWLNYAPDGHGFFWWGGYGKSTENTAYLNLKSGIMAPRSGSVAQNGRTVAEQIGGQIFIDVWGLIAPGQPEMAARYAAKAASVSHDGNGKYGGMFLAACIAQAFVENNVEKVIEAGLSVIPADCEYARVVRDIVEYYKKNPTNWRDCFQYIWDNWGYDRYPGACHIIPNAAVMILSLMYGQGDFSRTINICNMCGWDTDCNVGNVGTIVGVLNGLAGIDQSWITPINDFICFSSVIGSLNIRDLPWCASYIAHLGYRIAGEKPPVSWREILASESILCHFEYPGSTHAIRLDSDGGRPGRMENTTEWSASGKRSLRVFFPDVEMRGRRRVFLRTYYAPEDFNDSRYDPAFSPILYPGQTVDAVVGIRESHKGCVTARLYVTERNSGQKVYDQPVELIPGQWQNLRMQIPQLTGCLLEVGIEFSAEQGGNLTIHCDRMTFSGGPNYRVDFADERLEKWNATHVEVSQLTKLRGIWTLENGELSGSNHAAESGEAYTGDLNWRDYSFTAKVIPKLGEAHNLNFRVQGAIRSYAVGLAPNQKVVLYKNENGYRRLVQKDFPWRLNQSYQIRVGARGNHFSVFIDDQLVLEYVDEDSPYLTGMVGFSVFSGSHTHYGWYSFQAL